MTLKDWLAWKQMPQEAFAKLIGVTQPTVTTWVSGSGIPRRDAMAKIIETTERAVQPADFY